MLRKVTQDEKKYVKECRNQVKGANFALLYGAGVKTLAASLKKADQSLSEKNSRLLAQKLIALKKGKKDEDGTFVGGTDSVVYNAMFSIARSHTPSLPALGTKISEALRPSMVGEDFITGRTNFCIQASGAEMLSAIIIIIKALCRKFGVEAYFCVSIHDEIHYTVAEDQALKFCAVMNIAHFYVWNFFHEKFGVAEFPWQRAFFDDISIRHCVCKEATEPLITPSNLEGGPTGTKVTMRNLLEQGVFNDLSGTVA